MKQTKYTSAKPKLCFFLGAGYTQVVINFQGYLFQKQKGEIVKSTMQQWLRISSLVTH